MKWNEREEWWDRPEKQEEPEEQEAHDGHDEHEAEGWWLCRVLYEKREMDVYICTLVGTDVLRSN